MRRTKIVCTLGPASDSKTEICALAHAGMDVARLNFSHGDLETHARVILKVRAAAEHVGRAIGVMQDLPGPKIRIGSVAGGIALLERGKTVRFVPDEVEGTAEVLSLPNPYVLKCLKPGSDMYLADGLLHLRVVDGDGQSVSARVIAGGVVGSHKGVNIPDMGADLPAVTGEDLELFRFGMEHGVDWVAVSFVASAADAEPFRAAAARAGSSVRLLAKIERAQALKRIDEIIDAFDGVLVARGDLGIETPIRDVPIVQKKLVKKCNAVGKPVVVATQMLMSMVNSPRPTRAEVTDIANAILDGADAVMLSEETAVGKYPTRCVNTMARTAVSAESYYFRASNGRGKDRCVAHSTTDAIALASARLAEDTGVGAIVTCTETGQTPRAVSKYRPSAPIVAAVSGEAACGQLALSWGVRAFSVPTPSGTDEMIQTAVAGAVRIGVVKSGDPVVVVAGVQAGVPGNTSLIKYHRAGDGIWE